MPDSRYRHAIVCLTESGAFEQRLKKAQVPIVALNRRPGKDLGLYWKIWRVLHSMRPAIVHTRNLSAIEAQIPAFFLRGVKTIHGVHGRDMFDLEGKNSKYNLLRKLIRPLVARYVTVSEDLRSWLQETIHVSREKIVRIYNGVDQTLFTPRLHERSHITPNGFLPVDAVVIGTVGRLAEVKDQATLIRAFKLVLEAASSPETQLRLIIAGDGPQRRRLEGLVSKLGLGDFVWMAGNRDDIPDILKLLDIFVLPSLGEGISNTVLEAMATALPVIATRVGGNPELVEDGVNGYLVAPNDPPNLARTVERLLENKELRDAMGQAGLKKVREQFHWDSTVENYLALYDQMLA
jgi:sugar transferase (PEP-CTERM/EpsH1 system associated)